MTSYEPDRNASEVVVVQQERHAGRALRLILPAAIAVFVFLLSGGLGFIYLVADVQHGGLGVLLHLPREYTLNRDLNYQ